MKNTKKYIICLFSFLAFFLIACDKNKNKKEEEKILVCSDITTEAECDKKSNCEWLDNVCKDKQSNDEETSEEVIKSEDDKSKSEEVKPVSEIKIDNKSDDSSADDESKSEIKIDNKSNDSSADDDSEKSEKSEVVVAFKPTKCSDYVGDKLDQCGMKNLTPKNAKDRIICNIVNKKCVQVEKCEEIKVPLKTDKTINTNSTEAQRCRAQGCFVRKSSSILFSDTCHTNPAKKP